MKIKTILNNEFIKNVLTLLTGSAIGQVFVFVITPILTRLYSEELFGVYFVFLSTLNILKKVSTLRLEMAVVLPKKDFWAINAFALTIGANLLISLFVFFLVVVFKGFILQIDKISTIANYLYLLPASLVFIGVFEAFSAWNNRKKKYKKISVGKLTYSMTYGSSQMGYYFTVLKNLGLIFGMVFGWFIAALVMFIMTIKDISQHFKDVSFKRMKIILIRYKKIPTFNTLINFVTNLSNEIPIYFFTGFFSPAIAGFYGMANKLSSTPTNMMAQSIGQVFYQKASLKFASHNEIKSLIKKTLFNLLKISTVSVVGIAIVSPFVHYILGENWINLTPYILILLPSIFSNFLVQPISSVPTILGKQNVFLYLLMVSIILKIFALAFGYFISNNPLVSLVLLSIVTTIFRFYLVFWILKISKKI